MQPARQTGASATYRVQACNLSLASENKIHDDDVARRFGFAGGLVPGVEVYAYMTHLPVVRWGVAWLERGTAECRFSKPIYDGKLAIVTATEVVAGPVMGGALLAHTIAGLLDGRRSLTHPPASFSPLAMDASGALSLRPFYRTVVAGKRVLLADDIRNTGKTFERAKAVLEEAGATVIATVEIYDRLEAVVDAGVPNFALAGYRAADNFAASDCPMCKAGTPVTRF